MSKKVDESTYIQLLNSLEGVKKDVDDMRIKRESKLWAEIDNFGKLKYFLSRLTKDELTNIRQAYRFKGMSSLKKNELIDSINDSLININNRFFSLFDENQYSLIKKIIKNEGMIEVTEDYDEYIDEVEYYRNRGIIFSGSVDEKRVLIMPEEIMVNFNKTDNFEYQENIERNTCWKRLTHGLLFYYGTLSMVQLFEMVGNYTKLEEDDYLQYLDVIFDAMDFYNCFTVSKYGYSYQGVFDPQKVLEGHRMRTDLNFYPFTYKQIYEAGEVDYIDKSFAFKRFTNFLMNNYEIYRKDAEGLVEECVYAIRNEEKIDSIMELLTRVLEMEELEQVQDVTEQIVFLNNNTRLWCLKGYTPKELMTEEEKQLTELPNKEVTIIKKQKKEKIGRNDPCPCGSGKKYKKCCGKNK